MPVLVRNTEGGPAVFTDAVTKLVLEWKGAGDPTGEDIQQVPDDLVKNPAFMKNVSKGIFEIVEASPEVQEVLARQTSSYVERRDAADKSAVDSIDQQANLDLISVPCIGPNNKGTGTCGDGVPVREKDLEARPPLCSQHSSLAPQYMINEDENAPLDPNTGKAPRRWERMATGPRERQQPSL